jgi:hypothetical protein
VSKSCTGQAHGISTNKINRQRHAVSRQDHEHSLALSSIETTTYTISVDFNEHFVNVLIDQRDGSSLEIPYGNA